MSLTEHILRAVARRLDPNRGTLVPEAVVSGGQYLADLMWVTGSGYATEFEIKVSRADWRADGKKGKWGYMPPWVSRFIYAVPESLGIPDFVPPQAGVWHFSPKAPYYHSEITVARAPRRIGQTKVPDEVIDIWLKHLHCRFWYQRCYRDTRLPKLKAVA